MSISTYQQAYEHTDSDLQEIARTEGIEAAETAALLLLDGDNGDDPDHCRGIEDAANVFLDHVDRLTFPN